jgi:alpha-galactosidase
MKGKKIVLIGSGSQFTEFYLQELFKFNDFQGVTLAFVDRKPERLKVIKGIAEKINSALKWDIKFEGYTDRREALPGADLVYCFAAVNYKESWKKERTICLKHGMNPYEFHTSGVSSLSMGMRHIPLVLDICSDMKKLCPNAWLILDNNPLTKILTAVLRHSDTKAFGYCNGHELEQMGIEQILGTETEESNVEAKGFEREYMVPGGTLSVQQIGVNHMGWIMSIKDSKTGQDLYPKFKDIAFSRPLKEIPLGFRFSIEMYKRFGYFPAPGDTHIADYIWCVDEEMDKLCNLAPFDVDAWFGGRDADAWSEIAGTLKDTDSIKAFVNQRRTGWQSTQIARIMLGGKYEYFPAINIMNNGCISNLNDDVVVEVPGVLGPDFVRGINMGPLPDQVLAFCQLHATQANLIADAAALGNREKALQALLVDPYIASVKKAESLLSDVLDYNKQYEIRF